MWGRDAAILESMRPEVGQDDSPATNFVAAAMHYGLGDMDAKLADGIFSSMVSGMDNVRFRSLMWQVLVELHLFRDEHDRAFAILDQLLADGLGDLVWLDQCPSFAAVRSDPRFVSARHKVQVVAREVDKFDSRGTRTWA